MPSLIEQSAHSSSAAVAGLTLQCPRCGGTLDACTGQDVSALTCNECSFRLEQHQGIWLALPEERAAYYARFIADYEMIRAAEGRGSKSAPYYLSLPYVDTSGQNQAQWTIRARTYSYLVKHIFPRIKAAAGVGARVLDMGAGNGWMSYRLAQMGFRPVAVDLLINDQDGLGAAKHYQQQLPEMFPAVQAESTRLPFASEQFDAAIFNASFHYAENYQSSLRETMRCLKPGGLIVIADSPWYSQASSGERMLAERREAFLKRFGTLSNSIPSLEFLTDARLNDLEQALNLRLKRHVPFYGLKWSMRPWLARVRGRREPARFRIYSARKAA
ncbi:class I SAM-dependent methyltransferase [Terracidiphilus sp.]|jgi:ubiquinone/menaquinone biosynthesis C-methylase UbiE|uniref:class I SAM-dependent methyltransferase n=1 Tax=Terracidiphilus sp. TaxID=1964191 RepID=UPI003C286E6F